MADLEHYGYTFQGGPRQFALTSGGRDADYYSQSSEPLVTIDCTAAWGRGSCQGTSGVDINGVKIHLPAGAQPEPGSDAHMTVIDQADQIEYDFDQASLSGSTLTVAAGGEIPIGNNSGTGLGVPSTAAYFATLAGLIRAPELAADSINHALVVSIPCTQGYVWPAASANGYSCGELGQPAPGGAAAPPLGTRFQLNMSDAQIAASGAPAWEQAIMTAMAHYGLYVNDTNGAGDPTTILMETESDPTYTVLGYPPEMGDLFQRLGGSYYSPQSQWILTGPQMIPVSDLRVIDPCVAAGTCPGGGQPSATGRSVSGSGRASSQTAKAKKHRSRKRGSAGAARSRAARARLVRRCRRIAQAARAKARRSHRRVRLPAGCVRVLKPHPHKARPKHRRK